MDVERHERQKLVILGAGGFAEEVADLLSDIEGYELVGFVESLDRQRCQRSLLGLPVIWIDEAAHLSASCRCVCAVGSPKQRKTFTQQASSLELQFATAVHPTAHVAPTSSLGCGVIVSAGAIVAAHTRVGAHTILNRGCLIGHHVQIGDCVTVSPGANVAGRTRIGDLAYIAMGAIILDGVSVGDRTIVGAGAVVTRDVPARVQVLGIPARITKEDIEGK
jgi:sugar O-acyltransferase (sialic acid O-acetyltransferase NeuD family)